MTASRARLFAVEELARALEGLAVLPNANQRYLGVVRRLYGIGQRPTQMATLARELNVSRQRILQIRDKTLARCERWLDAQDYAELSN